MPNAYYSLDKQTPNGAFTVPSTGSYNIKKMRDYCKKNNISYDKLTEKEIEKFKEKEQ